MDPRALRAYQEALAQLVAASDRATATLFGRLVRSADPVEVREALELAVPELVERFGRVAGELSAEWFTALDPSDGYRPVVAPPAPSEQAAKAAAWAAQPLFEDARAMAWSRLSGTTERLIRQSGRETVVFNSERMGVPFARVARPDGCGFCRMLASRGFVYSSESVASSVGGRGKAVSTNFTASGRRRSGGQARGVRTRGNQSIGSSYHDLCRCVVLPRRRGITEADVPNLDLFRDQYQTAVSGIENTSSDGALREIVANMSAAH